MTSIKIQFSYLDKHFENDMNIRGLSGKYDRSFPGKGPYKNGEDFFKYFNDKESDNLLLSAESKIEKEWIDSNKLTKELSLTNGNFDGLVTFTFNNEDDANEYFQRNNEDSETHTINQIVYDKLEDVLSKEDPINYKSKIVIVFDNDEKMFRKYLTPTNLKIKNINELINEYFEMKNI